MKNPKSKKTSETIEIVSSNDDLLIEILVHLPLKPLIRLKLVSKHWNSIISHPKLPFMHSQVHNNRAVGLIFQNSFTSSIVSFDRSSNPLSQIVLPYPMRIFHSCNGLLVLRNIALVKYYYICNPTTNQITMPPLKDVNAQGPVLGMYLAFDPSKSPHYKVVCVWESRLMTKPMHQYQFDVYSSETGSWEMRGRHISTGYVDFNNGVYWNGAIHWVSYERKSIYFNPDHDEVPRVMPTPPFHHKNMRGYFFGESCDHFHCAVVGDHHLPEIYVYEMRRDYSEWFVKYKVDDYSQYLRNYTVRYLFSVVRGKKDSDSLVLGTDEGEIIRYNLVHNTFQTIEVKDFDFNSYIKNSFQYIESPCSV